LTLQHGKEPFVIIVRRRSVSASFAAGLALLNQIKPVGINSLHGNRRHQPVAGGGAIAGGVLVNVLASQTLRAVVAECSSSGRNVDVAGFTREAVIPGDEILLVRIQDPKPKCQVKPNA
jgi:hypothetical protein